jgi:hypothetical protein
MYYYSPATLGFYASDVHPVIPPDAVALTDERYRALIAGQRTGHAIGPGAGGAPVLLPPTAADLKARIVAEIQARLDAFAATRGYDHILSACTYAGSAVPRFAAEGAACVALRDATWAALYAIEAEVTAGTRPAPARLADILPDLPALVWPDADPQSPEADPHA